MCLLTQPTNANSLGLTFFASAFSELRAGQNRSRPGKPPHSRRNHEEDNYLRRRARGVYYPGAGGSVLGRPRLDLETLLDRHREADNDYNDRCGASRVPNSDRSREFNENHKGVQFRLRPHIDQINGATYVAPFFILTRAAAPERAGEPPFARRSIARLGTWRPRNTRRPVLPASLALRFVLLGPE
jgi:hypothetical protein